MSYYDIEEFSNLYGTYPQCLSHQGLQYGQSFSSPVDTGTVERGEYSIQDFPLAPIDFLNLDDSSLAPILPSSSVSQASANLPVTLLQNSLSGMLSYSDLDIADDSRNLPVAAPVPVPHAARTKAALRTMMSFGDEDEEGTHDNSAGGGEFPKITAARTQVNLDDCVLHPNVQPAINYDDSLANAGHSKQNTAEQSKLVVRPISPSTLMALTEPCLMAWCSAFDEILAEPGSPPYFPLQSSEYNNCVDTKSNTVYNAWGY